MQTNTLIFCKPIGQAHCLQYYVIHNIELQLSSSGTRILGLKLEFIPFLLSIQAYCER